MWIGVVDALDGDLTDVGTEELARELVGAVRGETVAGVHLPAVDALEHEHLFRHVGTNHLRHHKLVVVLQQLRDELGVTCLLDEVELGAQMHLELVGQRSRLQQLCALRARLEQAGRRAQQREVEVDLLLDPGAAHLHDHVAAASQQRGVDLCDRRRRERLGIDADEDVGRELLGDQALDLVEGHRGDVVDQLPELLDVGVREQIRPRGQQLPELDVGRPQLLEGAAELHRALPRRGPAPPDAELSKDAQQSAAPCHAADVQRMLEAFRAGAHQAAYVPGVSPGNAKASHAAERESGRRLHDGRAARGRRERRRAARRESGAGSFPDGRRAGPRHRAR